MKMQLLMPLAISASLLGCNDNGQAPTNQQAQQPQVAPQYQQPVQQQQQAQQPQVAPQYQQPAQQQQQVQYQQPVQQPQVQYQQQSGQQPQAQYQQPQAQYQQPPVQQVQQPVQTQPVALNPQPAAPIAALPPKPAAPSTTETVVRSRASVLTQYGGKVIVRSAPSKSGRKLGYLYDREEVWVIGITNKCEVINNIEGCWVKVMDSQQLVGYSFDGYLQY